MAAATALGNSFSCWLKNFLNDLSGDIDTDVFGEYIEGLLQDETLEKQEILESISSFLESVIPSESAIKGGEKIVSQYRAIKTNCAPDSVAPSNASEAAKLDDLEQQMRTLLAQQPKIKPTPSANHPTPSVPQRDNRDACTVAALRAAGVGGYQGNEEEEAALAVALADAEFFSKQKLASAATLGSTVAGSRRAPKSDAPDAAVVGSLPNESENIDLEEIEEAQGYGKKDGIKPGSVMDALSTLDPHKFGSSQATPTAREELKVGRLKRLPTPGDVNSSTPAYLLLASRGHQAAVGVGGTAATTTTTSSATVSTTSNQRKKGLQPSKHLADIGARAELKHQKMLAMQREKLGNLPSAARSRLDDMDAFFISDDDKEEVVDPSANSKSPSVSVAQPDILLAGGGNRERVKEAEKAARVAAAADHAERRAKEKAERTKQLETEAKRKATAQQRAQKVERRRR
ncbi:unnamed protein product [Mesocestoides corti]|uniref:Coiled-coil domain-containing protein 43 n=1 Tax=Mesocestoides corti TaxID=53468 RepID=A0A0R3U296_MESCO|nr:unnamed protein product [Mesocestoides corti]